MCSPNGGCVRRARHYVQAMGMDLATLILGVTLTVPLAGCGQRPTATVEALRNRLEDVATDATTYAPEEYQMVHDALQRLDAELATQGERFALLRSYDRADELATSVERAIDQVQQAVETERQQLRAEADQIVADVERTLSGAQRSLEKVDEDQPSPWNAELAVAEAALDHVDTLIADGRFSEAYQEAKTALEAASRVHVAAKERTGGQEAEKAALVRAARGVVKVPRTVLVDGAPLAAGEYGLRLTDDAAPPVNGSEGATRTRWVEFLRSGTVAARGLAVVIPDTEIGDVAESPPPHNDVRVEGLKSGEYVRVWLNRSGMNYLIHMPTASGSRGG